MEFDRNTGEPVRRAALLFALAGTLAFALVALGQPRAALACSAGPDWNAAVQADLIIVGRVTAFEVAEDEAATGPASPGSLAGRLTFSVDRYLKGSGGASITAIDRASLFREPGGALQFVGSAGACGALDEDPLGEYWVTGFFREPTGTLRTNRLLVFAIGSGPDDGGVQSGIERVEALMREAGIAPAATGGAGPATADRRAPPVPALVLFTLALVIAARRSTTSASTQ
jgi:hypothetical protein